MSAHSSPLKRKGGRSLFFAENPTKWEFDLDAKYDEWSWDDYVKAVQRIKARIQALDHKLVIHGVAVKVFLTDLLDTEAEWTKTLKMAYALGDGRRPKVGGRHNYEIAQVWQKDLFEIQAALMEIFDEDGKLTLPLQLKEPERSDKYRNKVEKAKKAYENAAAQGQPVAQEEGDADLEAAEEDEAQDGDNNVPPPAKRTLFGNIQPAASTRPAGAQNGASAKPALSKEELLRNARIKRLALVDDLKRIEDIVDRVMAEGSEDVRRHRMPELTERREQMQADLEEVQKKLEDLEGGDAQERQARGMSAEERKDGGRVAPNEGPLIQLSPALQVPGGVNPNAIPVHLNNAVALSQTSIYSNSDFGDRRAEMQATRAQELAASTQKAAQLEQTVTELQEQIQHKDDWIVRLQGETQTLRTERENIRGSLQQTNGQTSHKLQQTTLQLTGEKMKNQSLEERLTAVQNELEEQKKKTTDAETSRNAWKQKYTSVYDGVAGQLQALRSERDQMKTAGDALHAQHELLKSNNANLEGQLQALRTERDAMKTTGGALHAEHERLKAQLAANPVDVLQERILALDQENATLKLRGQTLQDQLTNLQEKASQAENVMQKERNALLEQCELARRSELQREQKQWQEEAQAYKRTLEQQQANLAALSSGKESELQQALRMTQTEVNRLQEDNTQLRTQLGDLQRTNQMDKLALLQLQTQTRSDAERIKVVEGSLKGATDGIMNPLAAENISLKNDLENAKVSLQKAEALVETFRIKNADLAGKEQVHIDEMNVLVTERDALEEQLQKVNTMLADSQQQKEILTEAVESNAISNKDNQEKENELSNVQSELSSMKAKYNKLVQDYNQVSVDASDEDNRWHEKMKRKEEELSKLVKSNEALRKQVHRDFVRLNKIDEANEEDPVSGEQEEASEDSDSHFEDEASDSDFKDDVTSLREKLAESIDKYEQDVNDRDNKLLKARQLVLTLEENLKQASRLSSKEEGIQAMQTQITEAKVDLQKTSKELVEARKRIRTLEEEVKLMKPDYEARQYAANQNFSPRTRRARETSLSEDEIDSDHEEEESFEKLLKKQHDELFASQERTAPDNGDEDEREGKYDNPQVHAKDWLIPGLFSDMDLDEQDLTKAWACVLVVSDVGNAGFDD